MTIKELAQELNMSTTTVSRVLTGQEKKYRISPKTALRVRDGARKHKFEPNQIARNLRLQETNTIGLIIPDISNPFFANLARTVEIELRRRDKMILLCDTKDETSLEKESLHLLLGRKVDGLLVAPVGKKYDHFIKDSKVPVVLIDRYFKDQTIPFVTTDNYQGAYSATKFLIQKGHQNITCIQGLGHTSVNENRILGYRKAMEDHKISNFIRISGAGYSIQNGYESTRELLQKRNRPTAIFALNNQIALGAMKAVKEAGLHIPGDVSLIAFDEQPYFELLSPALTAIQQPMQDIGKVAVETLFKLMTGETVKNQMLKPNFIERESVKSIES
ncbi:LacI family DNA-binding transcriptional regulator [Ulvibacterium sp.]|uniref:LacI family DNA-binding transcriptional regulator n=1 Tax=Ulvibacterium sp. TaxID=2665914 RepID=UPI00262B7585|nr:LacI family DNA-binding transcriptional regulator [Ulvibacterium sp.]